MFKHIFSDKSSAKFLFYIIKNADEVNFAMFNVVNFNMEI